MQAAVVTELIFPPRCPQYFCFQGQADNCLLGSVEAVERLERDGKADAAICDAFCNFIALVSQSSTAIQQVLNNSNISQRVKLFKRVRGFNFGLTLSKCQLNFIWHRLCSVVGIAAIVRRIQKDYNMTQYISTQIVSAFAAVICAFITIGISIAPAVAPVSGLVV